MFRNKSILFIGPCFHDYHEQIVKALEAQHATVAFFPERDYSIRFKIINNLFHGHLAAFQASHYRQILKKIEGCHFDYLLVVRGFMITSEFVEGFKKMNPAARTIMYQWDSDDAHPYAASIPFFDRICSFDYNDCDRFGLSYVPLFYANDISPQNNVSDERLPYDFFFMGTYLPERYEALLTFKEYLNKQGGFTLKSYIYVPTTRLIKLRLQGIHLDPSIVTTRHMSRHEYLSLLRRSKVVVDVSSRHQTGMAMRVIEALAMHKKVLTDNRHITREPFFSSGNICLFDAEKPSFQEEWVNSPFKLPVNVLSIDQWLMKILNS